MGEGEQPEEGQIFHKDITMYRHFGITHILINAVYWLHRPCSVLTQFDRVGKMPSVKAHLATYTITIGVPGQC